MLKTCKFKVKLLKTYFTALGFVKIYEIFITNFITDLVNTCSDRMKDNSGFELRFSPNHLSESKCRRGLNLDPMVQVTDKPCRLMEIETL